MIVSIVIAGTMLARPVQIAPEHVRQQADQPQIAFSKKGDVYVAFGSGDSLYFTSSTDGGLSFGEAVEIGTAGKLSLGMRRGPRIATTKRDIVVSAVYGETGRGRDGDLLSWRSMDGGRSWIGPTKVSDVSGSAREGLHAMAATPDGTIVAAWLDLRSGATEIYSSRSTNGGRKWSKDVLVYRSPDGSICECCHPSVATGPFGEVGVMFRNSLGGNRDMYLARSPDKGKSFGRSVKLGAGNWNLAACPMDGGAVAFDASGSSVSVWRRQERLYISKGEASSEFAQGRNPWLAATPRGPVLVWESGNRSVYSQFGNRIASRTRLAERGSDPVVAAGAGVVVATWRQRGQDAGIFVQRLPQQ
ncbi:MAG: exo-alpha-sialidase [Armatimonadetes bacterium]|nr:exo-alpha-sialidase [Armatimonadota bacterium]